MINNGDITEYAFLDTDVFRSKSFNFSGRGFEALRAHAAKGRLKLLTTDITDREIQANVALAVNEEAAKIRTAHKKAYAIKNSGIVSLPDISQHSIVAALRTKLEDFLVATATTRVGTSEVEAGPIFDKYFRGEPPFGAKDKKAEFPDAFVLAALDSWCEDECKTLFVVSRDKPMSEACIKHQYFRRVDTLEKLLDHVASDDEVLATFLRSQVSLNLAQIEKSAREQFEECVFYVADEDGSAEITLRSLAPEGEPSILNIGKGEAVVQLQLRAQFTAHLSYHPQESAIWGAPGHFSETREEDVECERPLVIEVNVKFDGTDPAWFEVEDVSLMEPLSGEAIFIRTSES